MEASGEESVAELEMQLKKLPSHLLAPVATGIDARLRGLGIRGCAATADNCRSLDSEPGFARALPE